LKEHIASIFRVEKAKQDTSIKAGGKPIGWLLSKQVMETSHLLSERSWEASIT
jgi:hypothetical protein